MVAWPWILVSLLILVKLNRTKSGYKEAMHPPTLFATPEVLAWHN
jgi:hypothetical protein